ncbi:hypothetical protein QTJ16_005356 [Diplocarpon rosae]|uniref:ubiquitinyl hydrolase 1 n=1 Tax=Diplocarpon rosae TaxID=946125 RepID=A0AAD9SWU4_9HELO|nr:hypothetical protein QTJ16_005356 [Diplocarpon rosae]
MRQRFMYWAGGRRDDTHSSFNRIIGIYIQILLVHTSVYPAIWPDDFPLQLITQAQLNLVFEIDTAMSYPSKGKESLANEGLEYMIRHVFLPPKLPGEDDFNAHHDTGLLDTTIDSLSQFKLHIKKDQITAVDSVIDMLKNLGVIRDAGGVLREEKLLTALKEVGKDGGTLPMHILAQNAGVIVSNLESSIRFEAFELSPLNEAVNTTKGRLQRFFPGPAISLDTQVFYDASFRATLAQTLATMSHQSAIGVTPQVKKAGEMHDEDRDTTHPKMVTELLIGFLRSVGEPAVAPGLWKNTREEVLWSDSRSPWRRSPFWLLIRVSIQLEFSRIWKSSSSPENLYKSFMVFLMANILERSLEMPVPSDLLYSMNAKISRRLLKLGSDANEEMQPCIQIVLHKAKSILDARWSKIMLEEVSPFDFAPLEHLDFERDTTMLLPELDMYLRAISTRKNDECPIALQPESDLVRYEAKKLPDRIGKWTSDYLPFNLKSLETWVASNLEMWLSNNKHDSTTCYNLGTLIGTYHGIASSYYSGNPEGISIMLLTILELWVACDKSATEICQLLLDYDPGVPVELVQNLLLPFKAQMVRLHRLEAYIEKRRNRATFPAPHFFLNFGHESTFANRYFAQSPEHQQLLRVITAKAESDRKAKREELHRKKEQYDALMRLYRQSNCKYYTYEDSSTGLSEDRHDSRCPKCSYQSQAAALVIRIHEWPLPSNKWEERCTVFDFFIAQLIRGDQVPKDCTYQMPAKSTSLQKFMYRPAQFPSGPSPNTVISSQFECPDHMCLDEYKALSTIPLGYRIQWFHLLRELSLPSIDFKRLETSLITLQIIYQAGPKTGDIILRDGHSVLDDEKFSLNLLSALNGALERVRENWESSQALQTFASLAHRILTLTSSEEVMCDCLQYLAKLRDVTFSWVSLLKKKAQRAPSDDQRIDLNAKAVEIAMTCADSFNVDERHMRGILSVSQNATIFIQCSVAIQEAKLTISRMTSPMKFLLHHRWKALSYRCHALIAEEILNNKNSCLDDAIKKSWSAYEAGYGWQVASSQASHWLVTQSSPESKSSPTWVHFNLLDCEILVNGVPLARLPAQYERHPSYRTLFGNAAIEVMPTAIPGMQYSGKEEYASCILHFGLVSASGSSVSSGSDLLVMAKKGGRTVELIPSRILRENFPTSFVDDFVHWYDFTDLSIELRPIDEPWRSSPKNWRLIHSTSGFGWQLTKDGNSLASVKSETAICVSHILSPLEDPLRIHGVFNRQSLSLNIDLPKLRLSFNLNLNGSSLDSKQFRGMSVDQDQSMGTLVGLSNKLILKNRKQGTRRLLVPQGPVTYQVVPGVSHVSGSIDKTLATVVQVYDINTRLGTLVDNQSLQSKLFLCYLHAITSHCLPDPLTGRTGTEQALYILASSGVRSFRRLTEDNISTLQQIARLTPGRSYYPDHMRVMQKVDWSPRLGFLAQHGGFYTSVQSIFGQAETTKVFYPTADFVLPNMGKTDQQLLDRDSIRSSTFRVSGYGAEDYTTKHDTRYSARHVASTSEPGARAFLMSSVIYQNQIAISFQVSSSSDLNAKLWNFLQETPEILGSHSSLQPSRIEYDAAMLNKGPEFLSKYWVVLHEKSKNLRPWVDKFRLMMWFSMLAYSKSVDLDVLCVLASFFTIPAIAQVPIPSMSLFKPDCGTKAVKNELLDLVRSAFRPWKDCPEVRLPTLAGELATASSSRRRKIFQINRNQDAKQLVDSLYSQFPCAAPNVSAHGTPSGTYIDLTKAAAAVKPKFESWFANHSFYKYLGKVSEKLANQTFRCIEVPTFRFFVPEYVPKSRRQGFVSIDDIFNESHPPVLPRTQSSTADLLLKASGPDSDSFRLSDLMDHLDARAQSRYEKEYVKDLRDSIASLRDQEENFRLKPALEVRDTLSRHLDDCNVSYDSSYSAITSALALHTDNTYTTPSIVGQWPRVSPVFILGQLGRSRWRKIKKWQHCIIQYGLDLTELQRAERLCTLDAKGDELIKELRNPGHTNWTPFEYPEALLLEVESGIMIRDTQEQIAQQMRHPSTNKNAVMQLNMGEGKSSVIVPIVAVALADGSTLVRVIVAKPQSKQMFHMLISKLGGLVDRRVYHMPFSRDLKLGVAEAETIRSVCKECMENGGILLVQPEHLLSFQLMGLECMITGEEQVGKSLLSTQDFFGTSCRDIVDESDENFSVKFELIYTMGMQRPIELSPERWICIQKVLSLVRTFVPLVKKDFPDSIEVDQRRPGSFPRTRFLRPAAGQDVVIKVARHICETGMDGFPIARQPEAIRQAVFKYITERDLTPSDINQVENQSRESFWTGSTSHTLLLLRGLLASGVLAFAFGQKRWRVNFGLDSTRHPPTKLAVPYRSKDSPAPRSEFSHPDVVIVLTSLSVYYDGLKNDELFLALDHLLKSDQAGDDYQEWVKDAPGLSPAFKDISGINLKDEVQCVELVFPSLRFAKAAVDYYLAHIVFPKEMKEFPHKLSASGWDIGRHKTLPTTGFSGTNDSRKVLPLSVGHLDLQEQKHTNALVLDYLLRPENHVAIMPARGASLGSDTDLLMEMVIEMNPEVKVILDVGAQILELSNIMVASKWLEMTADRTRTQAAVFFDDKDELCVVDRKGRVESWQTSPFAKQPDVCVIFLDEAHTRGTDLKLPIHYRAAVTLGPSLTKDRLVQACMRMRQLGKGQSVVFCIPQEIRDKILERSSKGDQMSLGVSDVLEWAISETFADIRRSMPLWMTQGQRFERQTAIWAEARAASNRSFSKNIAEKFLEDEAQSLEDRYRPRFETHDIISGEIGQNENLKLIRDRCQEFTDLDFSSSTLQEEQERELSPEIEAERQVQGPAPASPAPHKIHRDLTTFIAQGTPVSGSKAYQPAFETLADTSAAAYLDVAQFPRDLLVTADFASTIIVSGTSYISDWYQRPVQWILTSACQGSRRHEKTVKHMMIISPFEAHELLPQIHKSEAVTLHLYSPRPNTGFRALDGLDLYTVPARPAMPTMPRHLITQLNLFAGQLYFSSYPEYVEACQLLGLACEKTAPGTVVTADGFVIRREGSAGPGSGCTFQDSPVKFVKVLMTRIRRNGAGIDKTHMGQLLGGKILRPADVESAEAVA